MTGTVTSGSLHGRLTAMRSVGRKRGHTIWLCICTCGQTRNVTEYNLRSGNTSSCGCLSRERSAERTKIRAKHGLALTPEYRTWKSINNRCHVTTDKNYANYGGRGIVVCKRWRRVENNYSSLLRFISDMGKRPSDKHSIERIDNSKGYSRSNCRWATQIEQVNNTRRSVKLTFSGKTMTVAEWARHLGMTDDCLRTRLYKGWTIERALTQQVREW